MRGSKQKLRRRTCRHPYSVRCYEYASHHTKVVERETCCADGQAKSQVVGQQMESSIVLATRFAWKASLTLVFLFFCSVGAPKSAALLHVVAGRAKIGYPHACPPILEVCAYCFAGEGGQCDALGRGEWTA